MLEATQIPVANASAELPPIGPAPEKPSWGTQLVTILAITIPLLGVIAAPFFVWGWGFGWVDFGLLLSMYVLTSLGITVGFHRLFVHRSFATSMPVKFVLAVLGSMAVQGSLFTWVAQHRLHHQHSDTPDDPHSPHHHGHGVIGTLQGFWYAHVGWLFQPKRPNMNHYVKDLSDSFTLRLVSNMFPLWVVLGLVLPAVLGGVITRSWVGVWTGLIWGGLVRVFLVHHVTWSVNSACHLWGLRPFRSNDESRDNFLFGLLALGEGWHNTHHAFPTSARHGLRWWQFDASYWVIRALALVGLAWDLKLPTKQSQERKRKNA